MCFLTFTDRLLYIISETLQNWKFTDGILIPFKGTRNLLRALTWRGSLVPLSPPPNTHAWQMWSHHIKSRSVPMSISVDPCWISIQLRLRGTSLSLCVCILRHTNTGIIQTSHGQRIRRSIDSDSDREWSIQWFNHPVLSIKHHGLTTSSHNCCYPPLSQAFFQGCLIVLAYPLLNIIILCQLIVK